MGETDTIGWSVGKRVVVGWGVTVGPLLGIGVIDGPGLIEGESVPPIRVGLRVCVGNGLIVGVEDIVG